MTDENSSLALQTALAYHEAWTSGDLESAMAYVADDIVCRAPGSDITGRDAYRDYLGEFLRVFTGWTRVGAFGDEEHALLFYYPHTEVTSTAPAAEHFTIHDGQIIENLLVFDRLSYAPPRSSRRCPLPLTVAGTMPMRRCGRTQKGHSRWLTTENLPIASEMR